MAKAALDPTHSTHNRPSLGILTTGRVNPALIDRFGEYDVLFRSLLGEDRFHYRNYMVLDGELPSSIEDCDAWLVTGSKHGAYEDHPWIAPLENFIRALQAAAKPLVGICFGHQIIAQALGGKVVKFEGGWGLGVNAYDSLSHDGPVRALAVHQDQVVEAPAATKTIMSSDFCANAALSYHQSDGAEWARSYQFHPEFSPEWVAALIDALEGKSFDTGTAARGRQSLAGVEDGGLASSAVGLEIASFLESVAS
ncbi:MAG: type 1 glutamine amidotransferase [Pseudomonadota bacterium]